MQGFSLIEVLVALIIIAVGMLGLAKIQGLAYSSTGTANLRSLAALQTASMASAMRANHAYWSKAASTTKSLGVTVSANTITVAPGGDQTLANSYNCTLNSPPAVNAPCSIAQMAASDLQTWVASLNSVLPNPTAAISCPMLAAGAVIAPVACSITVQWLESTAGITAQSQGIATAVPTYTLYVVP